MIVDYHRDLKDLFGHQSLSDNVGRLGEKDVHLWCIHRNTLGEIKNYTEYFLDNEEQNRAQRFRFRNDHDQYVLGRYLAKVMLAYYTDRTPENVKIVPDAFGKPRCDMNLFFNISHSDGQLLLGFSHSEIGVDIERINPAVDIERIGESHFSEIELQEMMNCSKDERAEIFFEIWTKKESLIKGIGKGLSIPLQDFNVTSRNGKVLWEYPNENNYGNWYVQYIEAKQGLKSAFATQSEIINLRYFCLDN